MKHKFFFSFAFFFLCFLSLKISAQVVSHVIAAGTGHSMAVCPDGKVNGWGYNGAHELGDGTTISTYSPVQAIGLTDVISISSTRDFTMVIKSDRTVWAWGSSIGAGASYTPVQIPGITDAISIAAGYHHNLVVTGDGKVWSWGDNSYGQLGDGTTVFKTLPIQVPGFTNAVKVSAGFHTSMVLKSDGTVWTFGYNNRGQIGTGATPLYIITPQYVSSLSNIIDIAAGEGEHHLAVKNDGTVWSWGSNSDGQLGDGWITTSYVPVQVTGLTNVIRVEAGYNHSLALKDDGTVWAWGQNTFGEVGDGTTSNRWNATQVIGFSGAVAISAGTEHSIALKNDNTVWGWGYNANKQLGDSTTVNRTSPVKVKNLCLVSEFLSLAYSQTNMVCPGSSNGTAAVTPSSGTPPYTYSWSSGQTTAAVTGLTAGTYTVTVTDAMGMFGYQVFTIGSYSAMGRSTGKTNVQCNGGSDGSINLMPTGGSGSYLYYWSNGDFTQDISGLTAGNYTYYLVDSVCMDSLSGTLTVSQPPVLNSNVSGIVSASCGLNGGANASASGGFGSYTYLWSNGSTTASVSNLTAGTHTVTISDGHSCTDTSQVTIASTFPAVDMNVVSQTNAQCEYSSNGTATVLASAGTPSYNYSWNTVPVQTSATATNLSAGTYYATVTDMNGCTAIDTVNITVIDTFNITAIAPATVVISGTTITLSATGASSYTWTGGVSTGVPFAVSASNNYIVSATNGTCNDADTVIVTVLNSHKVIAGGGDFSLGLCSAGSVKAWGDNEYYQVGDGMGVDRYSPVSSGALTGITDVAAGHYQSLALKNDGTIRTWGLNNYGQLGDGTTINRSSPINPGITGMIAISGGRFHSIALKFDGTVWAWGKNYYGELGNGTTIDSNVPVQVTGLTNIVAIAAGWHHNLALRNDGTVWAWGYNGWFQCGVNAMGPFLTPILVNGIHAIGIAAGESHSVALKNDGTVWCWGKNYNGELGDGTIISKYTPTQAIGMNNVKQVAAGMTHVLVVKNDGTVWGWGLNGSGQLGDGTTTTRTTAVQTSGLTGVVEVTGGSAHSLAHKSDGSVWAWGLNVVGQIGDGTYLNYRYVPVQTISLCAVSTSMEEEGGSANVIFPNPSSGKFRIENSASEFSFEIYDVTGQRILQSGMNKEKAEIDLSDQATGIYFVKIIADGKTEMKKVSVQK